MMSQVYQMNAKGGTGRYKWAVNEDWVVTVSQNGILKGYYIGKTVPNTL